jgi:membrane protein GlpM
MRLFVKALIGAAAVVVVQLLSQTRNYYIAGLVPLFPTFGLISHYILGTERTTDELKRAILLGMFALVPYLIYLGSLYILVDRLRLLPSLLLAALCWLVAAALLIAVWNRLT